MLTITATINGDKKELAIQPNEVLLDVLRRHGYQGVKEGCREGECGACTVLVDGVPVTACFYPAARAEGKQLTTIEGMDRHGKLSVIQETFLEVGAVQCGYCTPGMVLSASALLKKTKRPTTDEIKTALDGNLCRCTGYVKIIEGVAKSAARLAGAK